MPYNPDIHHRKSIRLKGFDYSNEGLYFITICCEKHRVLFGEIVKGEMILNAAGNVANESWLSIPRYYPNTVLHEYVIMPDHMHGIIELVEFAGGEEIQPLQIQTPHIQHRQHKFQKVIPQSLSCIVRGFKSTVTKWFRNNNSSLKTVWQRDYYETIIRDEMAYRNISTYIRLNPLNRKKK